MDDLTNWVISELSSILQLQVGQDLAQCILLIESNRDLEDYLTTYLDFSNPIHKKFLKELQRRKQIALGANLQGYKKTELDNYTQKKQQDRKKKGNKPKQEQKKAELTEPVEEEKYVSVKKKNKFVNILSSDIQNGVLLKGRHKCNCQASKHDLINNCLKCGRIVCAQEGSGSCFFCFNPVYSREEGKSIRSNSKHSKKLEMDSSLLSAIELRNRLLEYDKSSEKRTHVIDDENDYFSTNSVWLTKDQREEFQKKVEKLQELKNSRGNKKLMVDFTGRYIVEDAAQLESLNREEILLQEITEMFSKSNIQYSDGDPNSTGVIQPLYSDNSFGRETSGSRWHNCMGRVQDKQVMEMTDTGMCLSMHQPWASLLVCGIKKHEGRSWYTSHRGRLWIASASKVPTQEEVKEVEDQYRMIKGDDIKFPTRYPVGCLLGCVTVADCLAQEDYREKYLSGESDSPFVFICENPIKSPIQFPMQGKHKIYKMDDKIHQAATKCIQHTK